MIKDYYLILDISYPSSQEEIKTAFRRQAMRWHPDKNIGKDTNAIMQDIVEAYEVLINPVAKQLYDSEYLHWQRARWSVTLCQKEEQKDEFENENLRQEVNCARKKAKDKKYWNELLNSLQQNGKTALTGAWKSARGYFIAMIIFSFLGLIMLLLSM